MSQHYPGRIRLKTDSGLKFLVKFSEVSRNGEPSVENALNAVEKIRNRYPGAEISVEFDVRII